MQWEEYIFCWNYKFVRNFYIFTQRTIDYIKYDKNISNFKFNNFTHNNSSNQPNLYHFGYQNSKNKILIQNIDIKVFGMHAYLDIYKYLLFIIKIFYDFYKTNPTKKMCQQRKSIEEQI